MTRDTFKAKGNPMPSNEQREAIGDDKVQRYEPRMIGIEGRPREAGMYADLHGHYVLHSAYAELAADRESIRIAANEQVDKLANDVAAMHERAKLAECQLAELRGRLDGLADKWGSVLKQMGGKGTPLTDNVIAICVRELRSTLAAADSSQQAAPEG